MQTQMTFDAIPTAQDDCRRYLIEHRADKLDPVYGLTYFLFTDLVMRCCYQGPGRPEWYDDESHWIWDVAEDVTRPRRWDLHR